MKTLKFFQVLSITVTLAFYGCKKNSSAPTVSNSITFTYQGIKYPIATPYLVTVQSVTNLSISAGSSPSIDMLINNFKQSTSFTVGTQAYIHFSTMNSTAYSHGTDQGTLTITSLTQTHISGTFSAASFYVSAPGDPRTQVTGTFDVDIPQ